MNPLLQKIKLLLQERDSIPFSEYMALCLFDPEYGYYSNLTAIGAAGDFITAPELGPYFANALAQFLSERLLQCYNPVLVELGGGTGQLAFDLLQNLKAQNCLPERYLIIEKSRSLQKLQQQKLRELDSSIYKKIEWQETLDEANLEGIIIANEFFDALPVERFIKTKAGLERLGVAWQQDHLVEIAMNEKLPLPQEAVELHKILNQLPEGYRSECCIVLQPILSTILKCFNKGLALVIDYGDIREHYYHFLRNSGTITAYQDHRIVSVFSNPGASDLTAHVDFTHLAECFIASGWQIDFLKPQAQFLLEQKVLPETGLNIENYALKRLLDPRLMGELFKVLAASFQ